MIRATKLFFISFIVIGLLGLTTYYGVRKWVLHKVIENVKQTVKVKYASDLLIGDASWQGFSGIYLRYVALLPPSGDTLLRFNQVYLEPRLIEFLSGNKSFSNIKVFEGIINLTKDSLSSNYQQFLINKSSNDEDRSSSSTYQKKASAIIKSLAKFMPSTIQLKNINTTIKINGHKELVKINLLEKRNQLLNALLILGKVPVNVKSKIEEDLSKINFLLEGKEKLNFPFVSSVYGLSISFKKVKFELTQSENTKGINFIGISEVDDLHAFHNKLSSDSINLKNLTFLFDFSLAANFLKLDSSSYLKINNNTFRLCITFNKDSLRCLEAKINMPKTNANVFFKSLPDGLFNHVRDINASGQLSYNLHFSLPLDLPDSVKINSQLTGHDFKIVSYGKINLAKINSDFEYTVFEKGQPVKSFIVGSSNKDFVPLGAVSQYIQKAILTSEDGGFFWHKGFNEEAFARSIAVNIKEGKFKRGGSTITMQLVKNVFLTRNKTISRKLEEILITWLIENQRISSKQRMFEVYLNVIEFGPMVYGIGPACLFYFGKKPADVTLAEAIFLSSLLPHPKWFKYSFDKNGELKPYLQDYFRFMGKVMFSRKLISENEFNDLKPRVDLYRDAKRLLDTETLFNADSLDNNYND